MPGDWPPFLVGIALAIVGMLLLTRARRIANVIARRVQGAPTFLSAAFLVRKKPATEAGTAQYQADIYRVAGLLATALGFVLIYVAFYGKLAL